MVVLFRLVEVEVIMFHEDQQNGMKSFFSKSFSTSTAACMLFPLIDIAFDD